MYVMNSLSIPRLLLTAIIPVVALSLRAAGEADSIARLLAKVDSMSIERITSMAYHLDKPGDASYSLALYSLGVARYRPNLSERERYFSVISMINSGYIYLFCRHNPEQAYPFLARGFRMAQENNFKTLESGALDNLAKVYGDYGDISTEVSMLRRSFAMTFEPDEGISYALPELQLFIRVMAFNDLVTTAVRHNMLDSIAPEIDAMERMAPLNVEMGKYSQIVAAGLSKMRRGDYAGAMAEFDRAAPLIDASSDYHRYVVNHQLLVADVCRRSGDTGAALSRLNAARAEATGNRIDDLLPRIYEQKALLVPDSAMIFRAMAASVRDSLFDVRGLVRIKDLETGMMIADINRAAESREERHRHRLYLVWILALALLTVGAMAALAVRRNRQLVAANRALVRNTRQEADTRELERRLRRATTIPVADDEKMSVAAAVRDILDSSPEIFSPDFSLDSLAALISIKPKYLSSIINEVFGRSFSTLLAEARVREACRRLSDLTTMGKLTIDAIAESVGYRSRTHFSSVFKRVTGLPPSRYAEIAARDKNVSATPDF